MYLIAIGLIIVFLSGFTYLMGENVVGRDLFLLGWWVMWLGFKLSDLDL